MKAISSGRTRRRYQKTQKNQEKEKMKKLTLLINLRLAY